MAMSDLKKKTLKGKLSHEGVGLLIPTQAFIYLNKTQMMQKKAISVSATSITNYLVD